MEWVEIQESDADVAFRSRRVPTAIHLVFSAKRLINMEALYENLFSRGYAYIIEAYSVDRDFEHSLNKVMEPFPTRPEYEYMPWF